ncbi:MAG: nuclear transport factor 2 family protein, partial [Gammaproteobacteria bacterium]
AGVSASLAKRTAERYVALVNAGDFDAVGDLFAEHARHLPPPPARGFIEGREAILAFYKSFAQPLGARIVPINSVADGNSCVIEFDATTRDRPDGGNPSMAIFTVDDDGKIVRMAIYRRELPEPTARPNRK